MKKQMYEYNSERSMAVWQNATNVAFCLGKLPNIAIPSIVCIAIDMLDVLIQAINGGFSLTCNPSAVDAAGALLCGLVFGKLFTRAWFVVCFQVFYCATCLS